MTENGSGSAPENGLETVAKAVPETAQEYQSEEQHTIEYVGDAADIIPIAIKNLIFNILTLSLYRFWGRTEVRRHIWSNIRIKGDPLEYTGTGGEMFIGFLVVTVLVFFPLTGLFFWAQLLIEQGKPATGGALMMVLYIAFLWLLGLAVYRAQRYRLSRTRWRGVRGGMQNKGYGYASANLGYILLLVFTFGLTYPFVANQLWKMETNDRMFGSGRFHYDADSGALYKSFFVAFFIVLVFVYAPLMYVGADLFNLEPGDQPDPATFGWFFALYFWALIVTPIVFAFFYIKQLEHFWSNMYYADARFSFTGTVGELIKLHIGNFFIVSFTFGVLGPLAQLRVVKFMATHTSLTGPLDLAAITQSDQPEDAFGEGLAEGFDIGTI